jgi:flagellar motility protein MotE (MotC chaperone)
MRHTRATTRSTAALVVLLCASCSRLEAESSSENDEVHSSDTDGETASDHDADLDFEDAFDDSGANVATVAEVEDAERDVLPRVAQARVRLDAQRLALDARKLEIEGAKAALQSELTKIDALEKRLDERLGIGEIAKTRRQQRIGRLAKMVVKMAPQSAAEMVAKMPLADAQDLLEAMAREDQRKASKLLSAMPTDRAAAIGRRIVDHDPDKLLRPNPRPTADGPSPGSSPTGNPTPISER